MAKIMFAVFVLLFSALEGLMFMGAAERGLYDHYVWAVGLVASAFLILSLLLSIMEKDENKEDVAQGWLEDSTNAGGSSIMFAGYCIAINASVLASVYWLGHDPYYGVGRVVATAVPLLVFMSPFLICLFLIRPSKSKEATALATAVISGTTTGVANGNNGKSQQKSGN